MSASFTLQVEHQQLSAGVLVGPVAEGQHGFLQQVSGVDLLSVVVVELPELSGNALLYSKPLSGRVTVEQKHLQKPEHTEDSGFRLMAHKSREFNKQHPTKFSWSVLDFFFF